MSRVFRQPGTLAWFAVLVMCLSGCNRDKPLPDVAIADKIVIAKSAHRMSMMSDHQVIRTYKIALGRNPVGAKTRAGDHKTPEGDYVIDAKKSASRFHLALHISYPNAADRERAQQNNLNPGGDIEIHGIESGLGWIGSLHRRVDWTDGCIAVTNNEIDEIWRAVAVGTPVEIRP